MGATCKDALDAMNRYYDNFPILLEKLYSIYSLITCQLKTVRTQEWIYLTPAMELFAVH